MKNKDRARGGFLGLILDMSKGYDRGELEFPKCAVGFPSKWICLIMRCAQSVSFSVLLNRNLLVEFQSERRLKQGDPLSPYLFILCAEVLSAMLTKAVSQGLFHGIKVAPREPIISHLFFV